MPVPASRERRELLARVEREFATATEDVRVGPVALAFTRVRDPDAVLDAVCAQEERSRHGERPRRELRMPYWAAVWESALGVGHHLVDHADDLGLAAGAACLDLGCGMGLAGMFLAALGGRVTLADVETAALLFARLNTLPWRDRCRVRRVDWQRDALADRFDLIVGSDVLYDRQQWDFLDPFWRRHLTGGGRVLLGEPGRPKAVEFPDWAAARGWAVTRQAIDVPGKRVNVFVLSRGGL